MCIKAIVIIITSSITQAQWEPETAKMLLSAASVRRGRCCIKPVLCSLLYISISSSSITRISIINDMA